MDVSLHIAAADLAAPAAQAVVRTQVPGTDAWTEVGRTEALAEPSRSPAWAHAVSNYEFSFGRVQPLRVELDGGGGARAEFTLAELLAAPAHSLTSADGVIVQGHPTPAGSGSGEGHGQALAIQFSARQLRTRAFGGKPDARVVIARDGMQVWASAPKPADVHPTWAPALLPLAPLCGGGDTARPLSVELWDGDSCMGAVETSVDELLRLPRNLPVVPKAGSGWFRRKEAGKLRVTAARLLTPTMADYVRCGVNIELIVAVGARVDAPVRAAARDVTAVLELYDSDGAIPVYQCRGREFAELAPAARGVAGVMAALDGAAGGEGAEGYALAPLVDAAVAHVARGTAYAVVLLIIPGGGRLLDEQEAVDRLVAAATLPLSFIIVSTQDRVDEALRRLDGDDERLRDSRGVAAARDIVQCVAADEHARALDEVPRQFLGYFEAVGGVSSSAVCVGSACETAARLAEVERAREEVLELAGADLSSGGLLVRLCGLDWLTELDIANAGLRALPPSVGRLRALRKLSVVDNLLSALPEELAALERLERLNVSYNELTALGPLPPALLRLRVSNNRLAALALARLPPGLAELDASSNALASLDGGALPAGLRQLVVAFNQLEALGALPAGLQQLDACGNRLAGALEPLPASLETLRLSHNALESVAALDGCMPALRILAVDSNRLTALAPALPALWELDAARNAVAAFSGAPFESLQTLDLSHNALQEFPDLGQCAGLQWVDLGGNGLRRPEGVLAGVAMVNV